jgi:hypothetical protein
VIAGSGRAVAIDAPVLVYADTLRISGLAIDAVVLRFAAGVASVSALLFASAALLHTRMKGSRRQCGKGRIASLAAPVSPHGPAS